MRIAPAHAHTVPAHSNPAPAAEYVSRAQWLLQPGSVVVGLQALDAATVRVTVADPFVTDPHDRIEADHLAADSARTVLEQALHGVRIIPVTRDGYVGRLRELAPAQLTFATGLPGVQRYDLVPEDLDHDGFLAPHELSHRIEVDTDEDVTRLDWLLRDRFDEGSIQDGLVSIVVPRTPWRAVPDTQR
jgi:hypothetical protein